MWEIFTYGAWAMLTIIIGGIVGGIVHHYRKKRKLEEEEYDMESSLSDIVAESMHQPLGSAHLDVGQAIWEKEIFPKLKSESVRFFGGGSIVLQYRLDPKKKGRKGASKKATTSAK